MTLTITPAELVDIVQDLPQFPLLPAWDIHCSVDGQTGYCLAVPLTQNLYLFPVQVQSQRTEQASGHCDSSLNRRELQLSGESHVIGIAGIATLIVRRPFGECDIDRIQDQIREAGTGRGTLGKSVFQTAQTGQQNGNIPGITGRLKQRIYLRDMQRGKEIFDIQFQDDRLADMKSGIVFDAPAGTERGRGGSSRPLLHASRQHPDGCPAGPSGASGVFQQRAETELTPPRFSRRERKRPPRCGSRAARR